MSRHITIVVRFFIVLMTSLHVTGQTHDVAQLNRRLTFIKSSVDSDISDIRFLISELKMTIEQIVVDQRNASDGSIIGQGVTVVNQKEITDLMNNLKAHESRLNRLFSTVNEIQVENSALKGKVNLLIEKKEDDVKAELLKLKAGIETECDDRFNALQKKFEETTAVMMKGYKDLKTHMSDQMKDLSQSVISEQNKLSARIDKAYLQIVRLDGEANKLDSFVGDIKELKTKIGQIPFSHNGYRVKAIFGSDLKKNIKVGTRVVRSTDWRYGDQDGGGPGTVTLVDSHDWAYVKWDKGGGNSYRNGAIGKYELLILADEQ